MMRIIAFTNNKGGTGKSTLCGNCAHWLAQAGQRVLVVDLTSQRTSSLLLLGDIDDGDEDESILALLRSDPQVEIRDLIYESDKGMDVIPSHVLMANGVEQLSQLGVGREKILNDHLIQLQPDYDFVLLDSPGDLNVLTTNVLVAANLVVIPTRLNRTDFSCTEVTLRFIRQAQPLIGSRDCRVVINMLDDRYLPGNAWAGSHTGQLYQLAQERFGDVLSSVTIPDSTDIRTAFDRGSVVWEYKPESLAAQRLRRLVEVELCGV
ncbi:MAG: ParA family protein [Synechococcaceae cyanobacterium RM1_1_27]|nr:ParA family protein [Synechococcaceae cyanobacterium SM2_3_2]NJO85339.1 ParA family protein [Synechococcaceae cyanobacterium RM1_1_27]